MFPLCPLLESSDYTKIVWPKRFLILKEKSKFLQNMEKRVVNPDSVFNSLKYGFSQAVVVQGGKRVMLSGQVGVDSNENTIAPDLAPQTNASIDNIEKILAEIDGDLSHVAIMRIYILESEKNNQDVISEILLERFSSNPPATSWIFVSGLSLPEWLIEIEAEAILPLE